MASEPQTSKGRPAAPSFRVEFRLLDRIAPDPHNARRHPEGQIAEIRRAIETWGFTTPALVDGNGVLAAGHGRLEAVRRIYAAGGRVHLPPGPAAGGAPIPPMTMPVLDCTGWSEAQRRAYAVADNRIPLNAAWDESLLREVLADLPEGIDAGLLGFGERELERLMDEGDPLAVFEMPTGPVADRFWITVRGPLVDQAAALQRLRAAMADLPGVEVRLGTTPVEG